MSEQFEPVIVGFLCNWCSYRAADLAGTSRLQYAPNMRVIRVMCSGRVDPQFVLKALRDDGAGHININTQGSIPSTLEKCLPYIDSVWFDIKTTSNLYHKVARPRNEPWELITKSIELAMKSDVAFWPRTTYVGGLMSPSEIEGIMDFLSSIGFITK